MKSNRILKIGFDAKRLFNNFTGLGNYSRTLVANLQANYPQHEYHLFTNKITHNSETLPFTQPPFIIHQPENGLDRILWRTAKQSKTINQLQLDIYHGLSHEIPYGIGPRTKTVVTFHDLIYEKIPSHFGFWNAKIYRYKYRSAAQRCDKVIAISEQTKKDLIDLYKLKADKIEVVYQSLNKSFLQAPIENVAKDYFLYVGSIIPRKGLKRIIQAYALLNETNSVPLVVVGNGDKYKQECIDLSETLGIAHLITWKEKVANDELYAIYDRCMALILPSDYEGFGIPIIEALARHKPVITTQNSAMAEACGPGGILIDPRDEKQLAMAMEQIQDSRTRNKLIAEGNAYVTYKFNGDQLTDQLIKVYESLL